jgi:hypothetical protein
MLWDLDIDCSALPSAAFVPLIAGELFLGMTSCLPLCGILWDETCGVTGARGIFLG